MSDEEHTESAEDELARSDREWAAQADASPAASGVLGGAAAGGPPPGGAPRTADRPRGPKPVRGPSGNAMGWLRGLGLLSILLAVGIMALLSWRILSDTGGDDVQIVRGGAPSSVVPGDVPAGDVPAGGAEPGAANAERAAAAACETDRRTVETAAMVYELEMGSKPPDVQALVDADYVKPGRDLQVEILPDGTVVSTGTCAAG